MPIGMPPTYYEWARMILCEDEGQHLFVYDDATGARVMAGYRLVGNPSVGYGRDLSLRGITSAEATVMLHGDLAEAELAAAGFAGPAWSGLSPIRRAVLMSVAHDLGADGLRRFGGLRAAVAAADWVEAWHEIADSKAAERAPRRYERLALMLRDDAYHPAR